MGPHPVDHRQILRHLAGRDGRRPAHLAEDRGFPEDFQIRQSLRRSGLRLRADARGALRAGWTGDDRRRVRHGAFPLQDGHLLQDPLIP